MRDKTIIAALIFAAVLASGAALGYGRNGFSVPGVHSPGTTGASVSFTELAQGIDSTLTKRTNYVITSDTELRALWSMLGRSDAVPTVDFDSQSVIAVFAGEEPTLGYTIAVSAITDDASRLVSIVLTKPGGSCVVGQAVTSPYQVVLVAKTDLSLTHEDTIKTESCLR